jgi:hypothetical protein
VTDQSGLIADYLAPKGKLPHEELDTKRLLLLQRFVECYHLDDYSQAGPEVLVGTGRELPGYMDHPEVFYRNGSPWVWTSQPYQIDSRSETEALKNLLDFCALNELKFFISSYSWWYPGSTLLIAVESKEATAQCEHDKFAPISRAHMNWVASDAWSA